MRRSEPPDLGRLDSIVAGLHGLHPKLIDLSLGRLQHLLARLDHPERRLPPVIHVAGTNGKGSTCAFIRSIAEQAGWRVHVYSSPHLVQFTERIRLAGALVDSARLEATLEELERVNDGASITVFEMITAAAFHLFAEVPADLCVIEVGLGGRFDATNVIAAPVAAAITSISLDHQEFLGGTLAEIAGEKAGIIKPNVPAITGLQSAAVLEVLERNARECGADLLLRGRDWHVAATAGGLRFEDCQGRLALPRPGLLGDHQIENAGIAIASLRAAALPRPVEDAAYRAIGTTFWPGRLQWLRGDLGGTLPAGWELWLDGGHNAGAALVLAAQMLAWRDRPLHLIVGMKNTKDAPAFLAPLLPHAASVWAVAEEDQYGALPVADIIAASHGVARPGPTTRQALDQITASGAAGRILICGSLYLAGVILAMDGTGRPTNG
jgi:dihydrofolate synthase/folylpolyglutamate synthase